MKNRTLQSVKQAPIKSSIRVNQVYPIMETRKTVEDLRTVGIALSPEQAQTLATNLMLAVSAGWKEIKITGCRQRKNVTVTGFVYPSE